jgi:hypothetical protein
MLGRNFYPGEDKPGSPHTILITYGSRRSRFGKDPSVVGRQIVLNNISYTIIGVLPKEFHFAPIGAAEFWAALNDPSSCDERRGFSASPGSKMAQVCKRPPLPWRRLPNNLPDSIPIPIAVWEQQQQR